jgi:helicase
LIDELPISESLKKRYAEARIRELYPPQAACVEKGMFSGKNLLVAIPTASGKTLIAEMAMHHHIARGGKCLYIVPLKALASEKYDEFRNKGVVVGISTGDFDRRDEFLGRNDIIVVTSEKLDSLTRNSAPWLADITLLVIDEVHLIDDPGRGPTLEMVITKMRQKNPALQLIALSATIGNPDSLAGWLDAEPVTSEWRPVDLRQGVYCNGAIHFRKSQRPVKNVTKYEDLNLCLDTIEEGGQCLVFVSSRRNAEAFAKRAAQKLKLESQALKGFADKLQKIAGGGAESPLAVCVSSGTAFHHAGLRREERHIVEEGFRKGEIKCIASTPTLAAGLNLPARRVIIRDYLRFSAGEGMVPIPAREYHQMAGRAGRPRLDPYGEAVLIAKDPGQVEELFEWYIESPPEDIRSRSADESVLCTHILSLVASGFASSREDIHGFMKKTFYMHQNRSPRSLQRAIDRALSFLASAEMTVEIGDRLSAAEYGSLVSRLYIDPRGAESIVSAMQARDRYSDAGLLVTICGTPDMLRPYVKNSDLPYLEKFLKKHKEDLWCGGPLPADEEEDYYRGVKAAMILYDWQNEISDTMFAERYGVGAGDVYSMVEGVNWLLHATVQLSRIFRPAFYHQIRECEICVKNGIKRELLSLIRLRGIGRIRARRLYDNGITSPEDIRRTGREEITRILGKGVADQIFSQLGGFGTANAEPGTESPQPTLFSFGNGNPDDD